MQDRHERLRWVLLFAGGVLFFLVSCTVCVSGVCVFGVVRPIREADHYAPHRDESPSEAAERHVEKAEVVEVVEVVEKVEVVEVVERDESQIV
jgi:hypothetical protein